MRNLMLFAGVAALAVSLPAVASDRGSGHGRGHAAQASQDHGGRGHGAQRGDRGRGRGADDNRRGGRSAAADRGRHGGRRAERRLNPQQRQVERAIAQERRLVREARNDDRRRETRAVARSRDAERRAIRDLRRADNRAYREARRDDRRVLREARREDRRLGEDRRWLREARLEDRRDWRDWARRPAMLRDARADYFGTSPYRPLFVRAQHCPPGLARQNMFCMPPGQLRHARFIGHRMPFAASPYNVPVRYRYRFVDNGDYFYRYDNAGAVYGFDRDTGLVSSIFPLTATGLLPGEPLPLGYEVYNVPLAYRDYYPDTSDYLYRYDDNAIYQVDADSMMVEGIVALLSGGMGGLGGLGVGDLLPTGYDAYNVPLDYRDTYYDTPDSLYRYADGSIYQVDPQTRLIESVISLLV